MRPDALAQRPAALLHGLAAAEALVEQLEIVLDVGVARVLGGGRQQGRAGARVVAAQHVGIAPVVEHLRGRPDDGDGLLVGAVGEVEAAQPVVGGGEPDPGLGVARMQSRRRGGNSARRARNCRPGTASCRGSDRRSDRCRGARHRAAAAVGADRAGGVGIGRRRRGERGGRRIVGSVEQKIAELGRRLAAAEQNQARQRDDDRP